MSPRRDVSMGREEVAGFLSEPRTGVLTTLGADGWPHSTAMWFVPEAERILMWTYSRSQKAVNLRRDPRCAFLVEDGMAYDQLRGVLIQGEARLIEDHAEIRDIGVRLYERYTQPRIGVDVADGPIVEIERQAHKRVGLSIPLARVASWDHRRL
ncbi:MAG: pyridoxamine 5'-phosphate oxidase family protein [Actinomycetota bacterium]